MTFNFISKSFDRLARLACGGVLGLALVSCGGGGGSAGTVANTSTTGTATAAGLSLTFSSTQITSTTTTPVTITAIAVDANNNGVANVEVKFAADSGVITPSATPALTNSSGQVTATLALGSNTAPRTINITVAGGGKTVTGTVTVVGSTTGTPVITLLFSSPTLPSASTGSVTITAQVEDSNSNALSGVTVTFTADSGILVVNQATTGSSGLATATLGTGGNPINRTINITATGGGASAKGTINVTGTTLTTTSAPTALTAGVLSKFSFNLQDSSGKNLIGVPVTFSASSTSNYTVATDSVDAGTSSALVTDINGNFTLDVTPSTTSSGTGSLTATADNATATAAFSTSNQGLTVTLTDVASGTVVSVNPQPITEYVNSNCIAINANYTVAGKGASGTAAVSTSRGTLFTDSGCTVPYTAATVAFASGPMTTLYLSSTTAGTAVVTVSEMPSGPSQAATVTFNAQITSTLTPNLTFSAAPTVVAANTNAVNPTAQYSILTATVRDGTTQNNLVQGVSVSFQLMADASGGKVLPAVAVTQANGQAQTFYYPGTATTATDGVQVKAEIQSSVAGADVSKTIPLTVAAASLFVSIGTGNTILVPSDTTYAQDWAVFVTDANGNPVSGVTVNAQLIALHYSKGTMLFGETWEVGAPAYFNEPVNSTLPTDGFSLNGNASGPWCPNTDPTNSGVWSATYPDQIHYPNPYSSDTALSGAVFPYVMPGIPGNVTISGVTNSAGYATVTLTYPKDHAYWTYVQLNVTGSVIGSQSTATANFPLLGLLSDYQAISTTPPGYYSPYGQNNCGTAF